MSYFLDTNSNFTKSNNNLTVVRDAVNASWQHEKIGPLIIGNTGTYTIEIYIESDLRCQVGIVRSDQGAGGAGYIGSHSASYGYDSDYGYKYNNNSYSAYGDVYPADSTIKIVFDSDAGTLEFFKDDVSQGVAFASVLEGDYYFGVSCYNTGFSASIIDPPKVLKVFRVMSGDLIQRVVRISHGLIPQVLKVFRILPGAAPVRQKVVRVVQDQARSFVKIYRVVYQQSVFVQAVYRVVHQQQNAVVLRVFRAAHGSAVGNAVLKMFRAAHGLVSSVYRNDDFDVSITVNGQPILSWAGASLSTDEGRFVWEAQIEVKSRWDGETLLGQYDQVIYRRYDTDYHLIVVDRARGIQVSDNSYEAGWTVQLASPAYKLSAASASLVTKTWPRATAAKAVVQELCDSKGVALDWQVPEYIIGELAADKQVPIDIIKTVLGVIGALPQSAPDGTLVVRRETPVMPYSGATPDTSFAALSISSLSEQGDDPQVLYNAVAVMDDAAEGDAAGSGGLQHVETDRSDGGKDILAWSEPWAVVAIRVNSAGGETTLSPLGIGIADHLDSGGEPEWLQFMDGEATASRPVYQGFEVIAYRGDDPGTVSWRQDSKVLTAANGGDYYVQVRYKWRYYRFVYYSNTDYDYQVILTD